MKLAYEVKCRLMGCYLMAMYEEEQARGKSTYGVYRTRRKAVEDVLEEFMFGYFEHPWLETYLRNLGMVRPRKAGGKTILEHANEQAADEQTIRQMCGTNNKYMFADHDREECA